MRFVRFRSSVDCITNTLWCRPLRDRISADYRRKLGRKLTDFTRADFTARLMDLISRLFMVTQMSRLL